jgi:hypothetical protein
VLVFIDESGDAGFKIDRGSSSHFVIACVIFDDPLDAEETALKIKRFRRSLARADKHEFKFNKCSKQVRLDFFASVADCNFRIRAVVVDKSKIQSGVLKRDKATFHNYFIKTVLEHSDGTIRKARIRIDGRGERAYKDAAKTYFRRELNASESVVADIKFVDSTNDSLIQLADMVAGAIRRAASRSKDDWDEYSTAIRKQVEDVWKFA